MERSRLLIISFLLIMALACPSLAATAKTGTASFAFLKLQTSVRAAAMGDAFVAVADDPSAVVINPAGLTQMKEGELQFTYSSWLAEINFSHLSYARPISMGTLGWSVTYLNYGEIAETTRILPGGTGRNFGSSGMLYVMSWGYSPMPATSVGVTVKNAQQTIDRSSESALAIDAGFIWDSPPGIKVAGAFQNVGGNLPGKTRFGLSSRLLDDRLLLAGEVSLPADNNMNYHLGAEYYVVPFLALRAGYNTRAEEKAGGNLSIGLGLVWNGFKADYAYVPYEELGATHRMGFGINF